MRRTLLSFACAAFVLTSPQTATAGQTPPDDHQPTQSQGIDLPQLQGGLSPRARAALTENRRIRVIVMLDTPSTGGASDARSDFRGSAPLTADQIARRRDEVLDHAFGESGVYRPAPATDEAERIEDETRPVLMRSFSVTPGFSLMADTSQIKQLSRTPGVAYIAEDALSRPVLGESTHLIGADRLWALGLEGAGVAVAILDTGVENEHPMTGPAITASACFSSTAPAVSSSLCPGGVQQVTSLTGAMAGDSCVEDDIDEVNGVDGCAHGTHVGSTAAGRTVNASTGPISGVARGADIIAINVFSRFFASECGEGAVAPCVQSYNSDQISALEWVYLNRAALKVRSINMSLGGGEYSAACDTDPRASIVEQLLSTGIATVIASGNDGFTQAVNAPGCISAAITVGATTKADVVSSFSNSSPLLDLLAPGSSILAAFQSEYVGPGDSCSLGESPPNAQNLCHYFASFSGTSMAAPHVAGAFALLAAAFPDASVSEIEAALKFTGEAVYDGRNQQIRPRLRVDAAHEVLENGGAVISGLRISPPEPYSVIGSVGDLSGFTSKTYFLSNESGSSLDYTIDSNRSWLTVDNIGGGFASTHGSLAAGEGVEIVVSVDVHSLQFGESHGTITVSVTGGEWQDIPAYAVFWPGPPLNDDFENALPLSGMRISTSGSNMLASKQSGEPDHADPGGASVWWRWTAPFSGTVEVDTEGSDFDTTLAAYSGTALVNLTQLAENDDINPGEAWRSRISFEAESGETYFFAVDGYRGDAGKTELTGWSGDGRVELNLRPTDAPPNDNFTDAATVSDLGGTRTGSSLNGTRESGEPEHHAYYDNAASIWYSWTAPASRNFRFTLDGTNGASALAVYTGSSVDALAPVASDAQEGHGEYLSFLLKPAAVEFAATEGTTYRIAIASDATQTRLSWSPADEMTSLLTAVLPYARSVPIGQTATAFLSVLNHGDVTAHDCTIDPPPVIDFPGTFIFQTTDPATNALTGVANAPVSIPPGEHQTFVFGITPNAGWYDREFGLIVRCNNAEAPSVLRGVNTFTLNSSHLPTADLVAIAATITGNGVVELPNTTGTEVFTVAAVNIGTQATIRVAPVVFSGAEVIPKICETDHLGNCLAQPDLAVDTDFAEDETRFFSIFVTGNGKETPFDPGRHRIAVQFDENGRRRGATNVAVSTP